MARPLGEGRAMGLNGGTYLSRYLFAMFTPFTSMLAHFIASRLALGPKLFEFGPLFSCENTLHLSADALHGVADLAP